MLLLGTRKQKNLLTEVVVSAERFELSTNGLKALCMAVGGYISRKGTCMPLRLIVPIISFLKFVHGELSVELERDIRAFMTAQLCGLIDCRCHLWNRCPGS